MHLFAHRWRELLTGSWRVRLRAVPRAFWAMALLGPLTFYAGWPWLWENPLGRFVGYAKFHLGHVYYNMEFLGETYWKPPMPRGYAPVMTLATVPLITLVLFGLGIWTSFGTAVGRFLGRLMKPAEPRREPEISAINPTVKSAASLWLSSAFVSYAPWLSTDTPIFGGTKHWLTAYPFVALLAGLGFQSLSGGLLSKFALRPSWQRLTAKALLVASVIAAPLSMTIHSHPWGLSAYTPLVGGAAGAATLGLNRTFWGYTTGAVADFINEQAKPKARVFIHDTAQQSWRMMQTDGTLRADLRGELSVQDTDLALYHHEPHMSRVEHMIWTDYGTVRPAKMGVFDGVPVIWVYERP